MSSKEHPEDKKKYFFFEDPDVIAQRAEDTAATLQHHYKPPKDVQQDPQRVQAYPFTFISAIKRKLSLSAQNDLPHRIYSPEPPKPLETLLKSFDPEEMEFVKPLKVPDLKICPKTDYSPRKHSKDSLKPEKPSKLSLAHRKLDFSGSETPSYLTNDEIDSLKTPNTSNFPKRKDSSREKENRTKKSKKDDSSFSKGEESSPDPTKRRNLRHISRKDLETILQKSKNDRLPLTNPREDQSDLINSRKSQKKVILSTKKDSRSTSSYSGKSRERSSESRSRTFSSESIPERNIKPRESSRGSGSESSVQKYNEESKNRISSTKEIQKKFDKTKRSITKGNHRQILSNCDVEEDDENNGKIKKRNEKSEDKRNERDSPNELFLDPRRISFREDSYSQQDEFVNLVTPELNFSQRFKCRKDGKDDGVNINDDNVPLVHPTALHMQFQAELHLFDSYNESLRQVMDVENSLCNLKGEREREGVKKALGEGDQVIESKGKDQKDHRVIDEREIEGKRGDKEADYKLWSAAVNAVCNAKEVQTQTVNDIATQTEASLLHLERSKFPGITYNRGSLNSLNQLSLNSISEFDDLDKLEEISLQSKIRTMSEISLHETTSSIKTETGTEISISTRDVTCSFNKYLDHEMAQLIKDEKLMYDKIEQLFKSREKTLNDRTRKLVKLEEQKRALRDTGQDSRISSVKKKQRALLLKLQQEKDEMNRLKELHKLASQERKLMLQKQRNMFNPQMSTKNILTKLKRSADSQSPRRLSGPMKGYDIRSNSSVSSLLDSDKSQVDKSRQSIEKQESQCFKPSKLIQNSSNSSQIECTPQKYDIKTKKFEEKMPKGDLLRLKGQKIQLDIDSKLINKGNIDILTEPDDKTESDTLVEDFTKKNCTGGDGDGRGFCKRVKGVQGIEEKVRKIQGIGDFKGIYKKKGVKGGKGKVTRDAVEGGKARSDLGGDNEVFKHSKKSRGDSLTDGNYQNSIIGALDLDDSQNSLHALLKHSKAVKEKNHKLLRDIADEDEAMNINIAGERDFGEKKNDQEVQGIGNISTRSHVSTFTISRHSSGDSEKSYSRSVVIRSQDSRFKAPKKLAQILNAREAAVATRRNCVEDWIAWHARLKAEESRVARMEEAAYKLVSATTNALCNDTTISSDTSDVEGRVELLAEKLTERRAEMAKLRREARRQAKQRLKALEANLLNQIKKYDTTIHEMRKKLDTKKGIPKENGKLAIEAKQIADFKVPEIPIKRIQEIYRNSDLLHSRSDSDLITGTRSYSDSSNNQETRKSKPLSRSIESVLEDAKNHSSRASTTRISSVISDSRLNSSDEKISEIIDEKSQQDSEINSEIIENIKSTPENSIFSHKMDFLQLNNQNLNEDISTLENDLKTLSEMMSKFSKKSDKSDDKLQSLKTPVSEDTINTSRDMSENIESPSRTSSSPSTQNLSKIPESSPEIQQIITQEKSVKSADQMDFETSSKLILSEIENSLISEHIKNTGNSLEVSGAALEKSMETLHKENEALSEDFNSLEGDIKSISEIISKMSENKHFSTSKKQEYVDNKSIPVESENIEDSKISSTVDELNEDEDQSSTSSKSSEMKNSSSRELSLDKTDCTVSDSFEVPKVSLLNSKEAENVSQDYEEDIEEEMTLIEDRESPNQPDDSIFLPRGESTTIDGNLRSDGGKIDGISPQETDELDDILDIIERDTRASEKALNLKPLDELNLEMRENCPPADLALNLTADVEPVLQKLTEILISVEKNIARRTEGKSLSPVNDERNFNQEENIVFNYENLVETDIDEKIEINEHLDEALSALNLEEELKLNLEEGKEEKKSKIDVIKDPEYEDISEESLEVSEILDRSQSHPSVPSKFSKIPEKYQIIEKTDNVLRILDEISRKSAKNKELSSEFPSTHLHEVEINVEVFGDISPALIPGVVIEELEPSESPQNSSEIDKKSDKPIIEEPEDVSRKIEDSEDSSDAGDTPREISEIDLDSPRDQNESRLDIEALDDDLLGANISEKDPELDTDKTTSEKEIEVMIDKLRASLEQPGLAVAELEARVLRIEQLQIELEIEKIKKLEAEEVSLYVREIPNKPPPPYTPPGVVRHSSPQISPTLPPAVIPTNVEELTAFTERATALIYQSKFDENEIMSLEAPLDILESNKDCNEVEKKDRKIYNTFLFDLCKETITEIYQSEYEKPGPSWTKPSVKTKTAIKIPKNLEQLTEYVNKEVATLFGFKTKLQRENMVMRWSRKRRDRVDELLAREAQAEEDEWTKFHHDELAVKNELTIAILDTLVMETTSVVKAAFIKKQKIIG